LNKTFFISDTHFGHASLVAKGERRFNDITEMDERIIENWNAVVSDNDLVWHLGDFAVSNDADRIAEIFRRLKGRKRLILGNHDYDRPGVIKPMVAALSWDEEPRDIIETVAIGDRRLVLCHYPLRTWPGHKKGSYHFYGHAHGGLADFGNSRDVGVDLPDVSFTPRTFAKLIERLSSAEVGILETQSVAQVSP